MMASVDINHSGNYGLLNPELGSLELWESEYPVSSVCRSVIQPCLHPIWKLPCELLSLIFTKLIDSTNMIFHDQGSHDDSTAIRYTSQVCGYWRVVALSCPTLWASIINLKRDGPAWIDVLTKRAQSLPLRIYADIPRKTTTRKRIRKVLNRISQIHTLHMRLHDHGLVWNDIWNCVLEPAPLLESFHLRFQIKGWVHIKLPSPLFFNDAPRLRDLRLKNCMINFDSPALRHLEHLELELIGEEIAPLLSNWLSMLHTLQNTLQSLTILDSFGSEEFLGQVHSVVNGDVFMPYLRNIKLMGDLSDCAQLLNRLILPDGCSLFVRSLTARDEIDFLVMQDALSKVLAGWQPEGACSSWYMSVIWSTSLTLPCGYLKIRGEQGLDKPQLDLEFACSITSLAPILTSLKAAPLQRLYMLDLTITDHHNIPESNLTSILVDFISSASSVEVICMTHRTACIMLPVLREISAILQDNSEDGHKSYPSILLPSLRYIQFHFIQLADLQVRGMIVSYLQWRHVMRADIQLVTFLNNPYVEEVAKEFCQIPGLTTEWKRTDMG
ncbi:hypothetical protein BDQ12DRAFT_673689 [Crucibulum laeve]|uniref:Uncharacterized protein n=1 Tax=Crucibulum laeve TaxID=68775 RepID=A0A5C3MI52_9AGAR|nr:hypothetical protein BDQ12DRAFT_673689 [Crucibulum laeve]